MQVPNASIVIGDFVHISSQVGLAGKIFVDEGTHVGIGACVIPVIRIRKWCTIGAGAAVIRDVSDGCTVVGYKKNYTLGGFLKNQ